MNNRFIFNKVNSILFIVGIILTIIGFMVMSTGDITISVIILMTAYLVVFPAAILWGVFSSGKVNQEKEDGQPEAEITSSKKPKKN